MGACGHVTTAARRSGFVPARQDAPPNGPQVVSWCDGRPHLTSCPSFLGGANDCSLAWKGGNPLLRAPSDDAVPTWKAASPEKEAARASPVRLQIDRSHHHSWSWSWTLESGTATEPARSDAGTEDTEDHRSGDERAGPARRPAALTLFSVASSFPASLGSYVTCLCLMRLLSCGHSKLATCS